MIKALAKRLLIKSVKDSCKESGRWSLREQLASIVPDLTHRYTDFDIDPDDDWTIERIRSLDAFQVSLTLSAAKLIGKEHLTVVDIGDSAGMHLIYLSHLLPKVQSLSVNIDPVAVEKIKAKGLDAICSRAENLSQYGVRADIFQSFEMVEHLLDPASFLYSMSKTGCNYFVITVPYVAQSRVGLGYVRRSQQGIWTAETTHIFELSPEDWSLLFRFSGWEIVHAEKSLQYPLRSFLRVTKPLWRRLDFEGFFGVILKPNRTIANQYKDWPISDSD